MFLASGRGHECTIALIAGNELQQTNALVQATEELFHFPLLEGSKPGIECCTF
jgi:hypothetical protein